MRKLKYISVCPEYDKLDQLKELYRISFPDCERKPFEMIQKGAAEKRMEVLAVELDGQLCALCFSILSENLVLLDYLAVDPAFQNQQIGGRVLEHRISRYEQPVLVEIESTLQNPDIPKQRRKAFYLSHGLKINPYEIELFGVPMEILSTRPVSYEEYKALQMSHLKAIFGSEAWKYLTKLQDLKEA